jgi:hypothetical protein
MASGGGESSHPETSAPQSLGFGSAGGQIRRRRWRKADNFETYIHGLIHTLDTIVFIDTHHTRLEKEFLGITVPTTNPGGPEAHNTYHHPARWY